MRIGVIYFVKMMKIQNKMQIFVYWNQQQITSLTDFYEI